MGSKTELRRQAQAQYFRASWAGKLALCLVTSVLPVLLAIFVTVLVDQYWGCQVSILFRTGRELSAPPPALYPPPSIIDRHHAS